MNTAEAADPNEAALTKDERQLLHEMAQGFRNRSSSKRYTVRYVGDVIARVEEFAGFSKAPPWRWTEEMFDNWNHHLKFTRRVAHNTQRKYQKAIFAFLEYAEGSQHYQALVQRKFQTRVRQIVTKDNCIINHDERDASATRRNFTPDEMRAFLGVIQKKIDEQRERPTKGFRALCRDLVLFVVTYVCCLRADEILGTNLRSLHPNFNHPEFGNNGILHVLGKAKKGGAKRPRSIPFDHPDAPPILRWYLEEIRPLYLAKAGPNEQALFLSERGTRLSYAAFWERFTLYKNEAGLGHTDLVMHCLRHTGLTESLFETDPETTRRKAGHDSLSSTTIYSHIPDQYVAQQTDELLARRSKRLKGDSA